MKGGVKLNKLTSPSDLLRHFGGICYGNVKVGLRDVCVFKYFPVPSKPLFYWLDGLFLSLLYSCVLSCVLAVLVFVLVLGILMNLVLSRFIMLLL